MKVRLCPKCKADKIELFIGGITGTYKCRKCGYVGPLVIEQDVEEKDLKDKKNKAKKKRM